MMAGSSSKPALSCCPFCGQTLVDHAAISHLERAQAAFEQQLRAGLTREAEQHVREQVAAARQAAEKAVQGKLATIERQLERERSEHNEPKKRRTAERLKLETTLKEEARRDFARREKAFQRALDNLREHNEELERKVEHLTAQDRGDLNEVDAVEKLTQAFPADRIEKKGRGGDVLHTVLVTAGGIERRAGLEA
jgi:DNA repair exonuclease SbcCD ATPase subunit